MMEWYYILGIISYGIFIIQCIASACGADLDFDLDFDGDVDFFGSDLFSFKGIIHFCMGLSGWLMLNNQYNMITSTFMLYIVGIVIGLSLAILLGFCYKSCMKFNHEHVANIEVGDTGTIYLTLGKTTFHFHENQEDAEDFTLYRYTAMMNTTSGSMELNVVSEKEFQKGDNIHITKIVDNTYFIN